MNEEIASINFLKMENFRRYLSDQDRPKRATKGSAGYDLCAAIGEAQTIEPGKFALVPTGIAIELLAGFEAQIRSRSGLALKHGIAVLNSPGTVDSDYRGEIKVLLINLGSEPFLVLPTMRIAQMVIARYESFDLQEVETIASTTRGDGGFGSTGI